MQALTAHAWDALSAICGFAGGSAVGSLFTLKVIRGQRASGHGTNVDQRRARAGGDLVGGNKSTINEPTKIKPKK